MTLSTSASIGRLVKGVSANALGKLWVIVAQLVSIPVLTAHWGVEGYGTWLMLITVPTYVALSDFGFGAAGGVELTRRIVDDDDAGALEVFQSAWCFVTASSAIVALAILAAYAVVARLPLSASPGLLALEFPVALVVAYSLLLVQTQLQMMVFRATNRYAGSTALIDSLTFLETLLHLGAVSLGGDITVSLLVMVVARVGVLGLTCTALIAGAPWLRYGIAHSSTATIRALAAPSVGAIALALAASLVLQGLTLSLGAVAGAATVASYVAARLITRAPLQISGLVTRVSVPELTRAMHGRQTDLARRIVGINVATSLTLALPFSLAMLLLGPTIVGVLSHGQLTPGLDLLVPLTLAAVLNAVWSALAAPLLATNRHSTFSHAYLLASLAAVAAPVIIRSAPLIAAAWAMVVAEGVALIVAALGVRTLAADRR